MKIAVISYSLTGNNEALAVSICKELKAEHIKVTEAKPRTMKEIVLDIIFNRTPKVLPEPSVLKQYDMVLFFGPIWMGQIATPLRAYFKYIKTKSCECKYGFLSISGGADGVNPRLESELVKRTGIDPIILSDLHIADLFSKNSKPLRSETSAYKINQEDLDKLTNLTLTACKSLS